MSLNIISVKITGTPNDSGWTQVHEFKPEDAEKLEKRGHLFAVIATKKKEEGITSVAAGRELLSRFHEEYFGNLEQTPFNALKSAVAKVVEEFSNTWGDVEIATAVIIGDVVYSSAYGGGKIEIYREGGIATILESKKEEVVVASGYPKENDYLILGTNAFFDSLSSGVLKAALEGPDISSAAESLAPIVSSSPNSGSTGVVIMGFEKEGSIRNVTENILPSSLTIKPAKTPFKENIKKITTVLAKIVPAKRIYVRQKSTDDQVSPAKKTTFYVGIILLVLLFVSIGFGIKQNIVKKHKETYQEELTQAITSLNEAEAVFSTDAKRARELFLESKTKAGDLVSREIEDKDLTKLRQKLEELEGEIMGMYKEEASLYLDLSLLSSGFEGNKIVYSGENIFVFDKNGKKVVKIAIETKKTQIVAGPEVLEGAEDILAYQDSVYAVFSDGIYLVGNKKEKVLEKNWDGEILAFSYTGNIYMLNKTTNSILRYAGVDGSFGSGQDWLATGITADFSRVKQIVIDGTIWILTSTPNISRFSQGNPQAFKITGITPSSIEAIHTNEDNKYVYLLDSKEGKILVLEKDGNYKAQYQAESIKEARSIVVSEKIRKAIILTKDKLVQIELKHL